tara:strand:- start:4650 stop:5834 length:1185 start_codon:yes stop_codon:yes gene_type:complete
MPLYKFKEGDVLRNRIKAYPKNSFLITSGSIFYNNEFPETRTLDPGITNYLNHISAGSVSLYEINVDRPSDQLVQPYIVKSSDRTAFKTISTTSFNSASWGEDVTTTFNYPLSASISVDYLTMNTERVSARKRIYALENTLNFYKKNSLHYSYSSNLGDKSEQAMTLISIPSIFYGSSIKKGSVKLNFYRTGSLVGELQDSGQNGELRQVSPAGTETGSIAGVVLYNEGFVVLTGSWDIHPETFTTDDGLLAPQWKYWGNNYKTSNGQDMSWGLQFEGTNYIPVLTMLAHAPKGHLNHSNNPTFIKHITNSVGNLISYPIPSSSISYIENSQMPLTNMVSASYNEPSASFKKSTYISKIGVYDKDKNLIAVAKVATPVKKTEQREYTFKLKLDI